MLWLGPWFRRGVAQPLQVGEDPGGFTDTYEVGLPSAVGGLQVPKIISLGSNYRPGVWSWFLILGWEPTFVPVKDPSGSSPTPEWLWNGFCVVFIHIFHDRECVFGASPEGSGPAPPELRKPGQRPGRSAVSQLRLGLRCHGWGCSMGGEKVLKQRCLLLEVKACELLIFKGSES